MNDSIPPPIIKSSCPVCGEVDLDPDDITLRVPDAEERPWGFFIPNGAEGIYQFRCPLCAEIVQRIATWRIIQMLTLQAGVPVTNIKIPAEFHEHPNDAPPITADDVIDFHQELERLCTRCWITPCICHLAGN